MKCKICSKTVIGRADKKFCSIKCKNYYHTNLRRVTSQAVDGIDKILHRNHSILLEILGKNLTQKKFSRLELDRKKFNFKYHTHINTNSEGKTYNFVYNIAWMQFSDDDILIYRR